LYADHVKLYKEIINEKDAIKFQEDMNMVYKWSMDNDIRFNRKKCHFLVLTTTKSTQELVCTINDEKLERVESIKDLSVTINYNMSFHVHTANIVNDACKRLGFVMRNSKHQNDIHALSHLFNGIVRRKREYASIIWSPEHKTHHNQIEQKRFSRYLSYICL
jgi:hypothetical protein